MQLAYFPAQSIYSRFSLDSDDPTATGSSGGSVNRSKYNDLACELEEFRELAANRLSELERVQRKLEDKVGECAALNMQVCLLCSFSPAFPLSLPTVLV